MIDKELRELRRRLRPQKNNITKIHGCYVTGSGEIITSFHPQCRDDARK